MALPICQYHFEAASHVSTLAKRALMVCAKAYQLFEQPCSPLFIASAQNGGTFSHICAPILIAVSIGRVSIFIISSTNYHMAHSRCKGIPVHVILILSYRYRPVWSVSSIIKLAGTFFPKCVFEVCIWPPSFEGPSSHIKVPAHFSLGLHHHQIKLRGS
jgi:hypothetical protein